MKLGGNTDPKGEISLSHMDWLMMDYYLSLVVRKPVFGVSDLV